ncbi:hypothetical protein EDE08_10433 [Bradyrhizobium sp. R2.2-H]|jgi:uncharacterized protein (DUF2164 family)|uniref:hypothetical protein n=1 Tax=unclassified Bradyrhizobium TaxID=2631580 RepID=UPI001045D03C|nr:MULTISPECIES: hypothetical protein [unclassified Bradyrhizobium]TCU73939.1 hypothetical protein EDE10_104609 [Bradyrhizobium sp. Y-H1]TCU75871.1 hypothetical protein EDE08_10433 [Bradyrhizobium sp. R2.2-H]
MDFPPDHGRLIELERADAARRAIEFVVRKLENWQTNDAYGKGVKAAVKQIREKWACEVSETVTDIGRKSDVNSNHGARDAPRVEPGSNAQGFDH